MSELPPGTYTVPHDAVRYHFGADGSVSIRIDPTKAIPYVEPTDVAPKIIALDAWEFNWMHRAVNSAQGSAMTDPKKNKDAIVRLELLMRKLSEADKP